MTDHPDQPFHEESPAAEPTEPIAAESTPVEAAPAAPVAEPKPSRWERVRPKGRLGQVAAILVATAAALFIVGSIFMAGFAMGAEGGGHHHGHGGDGNSHSEGHHWGRDGSEQREPGRGGAQDGAGQGKGPSGQG